MPALGGLCTGAVALAFPEILYQGFGNVNALLELKSDVYAPLLLLQMLAAKVCVTAVCRGSGLVGGIYAPSIFMGAHQNFSHLCRALNLMPKVEQLLGSVASAIVCKQGLTLLPVALLINSGLPQVVHLNRECTSLVEDRFMHWHL